MAYRLMAASLLQPCLLEDTVERPGWQVITQLAGDRDPPRFGGMLELTMTTAARHPIPAVFLNHSNDLANLHLLKGYGNESHLAISGRTNCDLSGREAQTDRSCVELSRDGEKAGGKPVAYAVDCNGDGGRGLSLRRPGTGRYQDGRCSECITAAQLGLPARVEDELGLTEQAPRPGQSRASRNSPYGVQARLLRLTTAITGPPPQDYDAQPASSAAPVHRPVLWHRRFILTHLSL